MFTDIIIAIVFTAITAGALCLNGDKIEEWQEEQKGRKLSWK